jgi:zinc finger-like protein
MAAGSVTLWPQAHSSKPRIEIPGKCQSSPSPLVEFLFFHKAIRAELSRLHQDALAVEQGSEAEITALLNRYHFLRAIYTHHSRAEDEVIFPALDLRVKNVAHAYSLEHKVESDLFDQMFLLLTAALKEKGSAPMELRRELICCTEAIQTTLCQHFSKEEEQVFPLLMRHFSFEEQADLVWQFLCSIPVNLMEKFLPWLATSLTQEERQQMTACLEEIVPEEQLLQQVVFAWLQGGVTGDQSLGDDIASLPLIGDLVQCGQLSKAVLIEDCPRVTTGMLEDCRDKESEAKKRCDPDIGQDLTAKGLQGRCSPSRIPINELLYWHDAIRKELRDLSEETRQIKLSEILPPAKLSSFVERLQFLAEVCIFHSTAEDKVLFPAVNEKVQSALSCTLDHAREEQQIDDVRRLVEGLQSVGSGSPISSQLCGTLCAQAEMMVKSIRQHLHDEEIEVYLFLLYAVSLKM